MKMSALLIASRAVISGRTGWTQGAAGKLRFLPVRVKNVNIKLYKHAPWIYRFCSRGALSLVSGLNRVPYSEQLSAAIWLNSYMYGGIEAFNDNHAHGEVLAAWDKAIQARLEVEKNIDEAGKIYGDFIARETKQRVPFEDPLECELG